MAFVLSLVTAVMLVAPLDTAPEPVHAMKRLSDAKRDNLAALIGKALPKEPPLRIIAARPQRPSTPTILERALQTSYRDFDAALSRAGLLSGNRPLSSPPRPRTPESTSTAP